MADIELQQKLQEALVSTYLSNLSFFSEYDKPLYEKLEALSYAIEHGEYKEKYRLEFIEENGDFDIYDVINDKYLYDKNPKKFNNKIIDSIIFDEKNAINTLEKIIYNKSAKSFSKEEVKGMRDSLQEVQESVLLVKSNILEYINVFEEEKEKRKLKKIEKFIFFGTLLGRHINPIAEKIDASLYFVCEKNLELFRLSLFVNDYKNLAKNQGAIFSIMDTKEEFEEKVQNFITLNNPFSNYLLKLSSTGLNVQEYIDSFLSYVVINKPTSFDYNRIEYNLLRNISEKIGNYEILKFDEENQYDFFDKVPVLFIAAGPSFHENIDWIRSNQDKFYIVTVGAAYKTLIENNIRVDMIVTLDSSFKSMGTKQFSQEDVKTIDDNTIVLASIMTDERILHRLSSKKLFLYEIMHSYLSNYSPMDSYSVGEKTVHLLLNMNVKNLYLIGLDLALNQETGDTHSVVSDSNQSSYDIDNADLSDRSTFGLQTGLIKVKGNFEKEVLTTSLFNASIKSLNSILLKKKSEKETIYNLSSHGAFFTNTLPLEIKDLDTKNFKTNNLTNLIVCESLKNNSEKYITKEESIKNLQGEIVYIKETIFEKFEECKKKEFNDYESFYLGIRELIYLMALKNENTTFLSIIFRNYFDITLNYLEYMFNNRKIKKERKKIQKVKDTFFEQSEVLLNDYVNYLEKMCQSKP